jgi:hypothetical protein
MYRIIYLSEEQCASWEFENRVFDTAEEAHKFALDNYFNDAFHVVKICLVKELGVN